MLEGEKEEEIEIGWRIELVRLKARAKNIRIDSGERMVKIREQADMEAEIYRTTA